MVRQAARYQIEKERGRSRTGDSESRLEEWAERREFAASGGLSRAEGV